MRQVDEVVVDGSYFDEQVLPPGFEQQPAEISPFRAAVAAVSVNATPTRCASVPGASAGAPAQVWSMPKATSRSINAMTTTEGGSAAAWSPTQNHKGRQARAAAHGQRSARQPHGRAIGAGSSRRCTTPATRWSKRCARLRIQVPRRVRLAALPGGLPLLASHESPPLASCSSALGKHSDNFIAEMLLKVLGAERVGMPGRTEHGARVAHAGAASAWACRRAA